MIYEEDFIKEKFQRLLGNYLTLQIKDKDSEISKLFDFIAESCDGLHLKNLKVNPNKLYLLSTKIYEVESDK